LFSNQDCKLTFATDQKKLWTSQDGSQKMVSGGPSTMLRAALSSPKGGQLRLELSRRENRRIDLAAQLLLARA
jgi:hypothetical protein